jgi:hypothetical protein
VDDYVLAQVNIGRLLAPIDSPLIADFAGALDEVNAAADEAPGFVWRLQTEDGDATAVRGFELDGVGAGGGVIINMSVWESVETLAAYAYGPTHIAILRRRREWFERMTHAYLVLWWIRRGHIPTVREAEERLDHLRAHGPTAHAFTLKQHFPAPGEGAREAIGSPEDWACPV